MLWKSKFFLPKKGFTNEKSFLQWKEAAGSGPWWKFQFLRGPGSSQESWWGMFGVTLEAGLSFRGGYWGEVPAFTHSLESQEWKHFLGKGKGFQWGWGEAAEGGDTHRNSLHILAPPGLIHKVWTQPAFQVLWDSSPLHGKEALEWPHLLSAWCVWFLARFEIQAVLGTLRAWPGNRLSGICCSTVHRQALEQNWKDAPWDQTVHPFCPLTGKIVFLSHGKARLRFFLKCFLWWIFSIATI